MPTQIQIETVKQQVRSFLPMGYLGDLAISSQREGHKPRAYVKRGLKIWKFADPDWDVVIKQLACFYQTVKTKNATN